MARVSGGQGRVTANIKLPSGKTLRQEILDRTGRTARSLPKGIRFNRAGPGGTVPFSLEDFIRTDVLDALHNGTSQTDYLDRYSDGRPVNPFGDRAPDKQKIRDIINIYDEEQTGSAISHYDPATGATYKFDRTIGRTVKYAPDGTKIIEYPTHVPETSSTYFTEAAPLSDVPTATTNPSRPRTVAAGYEYTSGHGEKGKITVVFRDGTYYNYYEVPLRQWDAFKAAPSKGAFIRQYLDSHPRGRASSSNLDPTIREELYRILRTVQRSDASKRARDKGAFLPKSKRIRTQDTRGMGA